MGLAGGSGSVASLVAFELAARDVPGAADVLEDDPLARRLVLGGVPARRLWRAIALRFRLAQRFDQHAAVERRALVQPQQVGQGWRDVDVAHRRRVAEA